MKKAPILFSLNHTLPGAKPETHQFYQLLRYFLNMIVKLTVQVSHLHAALAICYCCITQRREISLELCTPTDGHMTTRCLITKLKENEVSVALELEHKKLL